MKMNRTIRRGLLFAFVCTGAMLLGTGAAGRAYAEDEDYYETGTYEGEDDSWNGTSEDNWDDEEDQPIEDANHVI